MRFDREIYESLLLQVEKPGRYLGNERGAVRKDPSSVRLRFALAFPDVYEIAQSHPGLQILYDLLNRRADTYAERAYAPWTDFEALLRASGQPLVSLETFTPLREFDIVGFSLQYELTYTNILAMLDLGGIPLLARERGPDAPLVIAGGPCAFNPEPVADFFDAILLGDGEEAVHDICDTYLAWDGGDRMVLLERLSQIDGIYVPSFYTPEYAEDGRYLRTYPNRPDQPPVVEKRILRDLNTVPIQQVYVVPNMKVVHGRPSLEVMRGCVKGCRFCQAGYIYRPLRERDPRRIVEQAEQAVEATGTDELSLLSLSTGDYSCVNPVLTELMNRFSSRQIAMSLPSTRVDALAPSLLEQIRRVRKTGFTLAPEAGSQRLRNIIQKEYEEAELIEAARQIFGLGWRSVKLYFMIGLPGETEEDLLGIVELAAKVKAAAPRHGEVTASVSTFVPKPHTPFQWAAQIDVAETERRQAFLRRELARRGIRFKWHDAHASYLEGLISRGDRRIAALILAAYQLGCRFDGWTDQCRMDLWERALAQTGIDGPAQLRRRLLDEPLPWDHISCGVTKKFLHKELARAAEGLLTPDCSVERCTYCGACDFKCIRNIDFHVAGAKGSDHRGDLVDHWAQEIVENGNQQGSWEPRGWQKIRARLAEGKEWPRTTRSGNPEQLNEAHALEKLDELRGNGRMRPNTNGLGTAEEWLSPSEEGLMADRRIEPPLMRFRLTYRKLARSRFISHLEMIEVFSSAFRRAKLPIAFTQGHSPRPRFRFGPGLPVGYESDCEFLDVDLVRPVSEASLIARLSAQLPEGLSVVSADAISLQAPAIETELLSTYFQVDLAPLYAHVAGLPPLAQCVQRFLASDSFFVLRRSGNGTRRIDARVLVTELRPIGVDRLEVGIRFTHAGSIKPSDLTVALLGLDPEMTRFLAVRKVLCLLRSGNLQTGCSSAELPAG